MELTVKSLQGFQKRLLLTAARKAISGRLSGENSLPEVVDDPVFSARAATFVTLKISGRLRGCIGTLEPVSSLWRSVCDNAVSSAFNDQRFPPLDRRELDRVEIEISVLTPPVVLDYQGSAELLDKLSPGEDGVIIRDGHLGATFLPQVWQQLPAPEQFLAQLCLKAGLAKDGWRDGRLEVSTYHVFSFKEERK